MVASVLRRKWFVWAFVAAIQLCKSESGVAGSYTPTPSQELKQKLFGCGYDPLVRPVLQHANTTQVAIHVRVMFLFFHDNDNTLDVHTWSQYKWTDEHLTWDKSEYDGIETLHVPSSSIWVPDIELYSSANLKAASTAVSGRDCWLRSSGQVTCVVPTLYSAHCAADISRWPYDSHNCSVRVGSWTQSAAQINVSLIGNGLSSKVADGFHQNRDWELVASGANYRSMVYRNTTHPWIQYYFVIERNSAGLTATVVIPALVLAIMTLMVFLVHPDSSDRIGLICVTALCSCLYLVFLDATLPGNGENYPVILLFYRNTLLLVGISLLLTLFERSLGKASSYPPTWVSIIFSLALDSKVGQAIFILRAGGATAGGSAFSERAEEGAVIPGWRSIVFILDHLAFAIYASTFFILIIAYVV